MNPGIVLTSRMYARPSGAISRSMGQYSDVPSAGSPSPVKAASPLPAKLQMVPGPAHGLTLVRVHYNR